MTTTPDPAIHAAAHAAAGPLVQAAAVIDWRSVLAAALAAFLQQLLTPPGTPKAGV